MEVSDVTAPARSPGGTGEVKTAGSAGAGGWRSFRADLARYRGCAPGYPAPGLMLLNQGLWALFQYRMARSLYDGGAPAFLKRPLLGICVIWQKVIEVLTGIQLPYRAHIAPGLFIGHFGGIIIHPDTVIGAGCNLSQGVTIGVSGRGQRRGVPTLGERVWVGPNAVIAGNVRIGDDALIAAGALITRDVPPCAVMLGNPAQVVSYEGSAAYLSPSDESKLGSV